MSTYEIGAFTEAELLAQGTAGSNIGYGDTFVMPASTSVTMDIWDNDSYLSGDNRHNENANDHTGQTATITENGSVLSSGEQIYAECYHWVKDQAGNWYIMIEIEVENESGDYFSFYGDVPPEGSVLTVSCSRNVKCNWINYCNLQDPDNVSPPLAMDDALEISESETGGLNVLANDMDLDGTAITVTAVEGGTVGSSFVVETPEGYDALVTLNADGSLTVVPGPEFEAIQFFNDTATTEIYTITDADGLTDTATVTVTVNGETTLEAADDAILVWESEAAGDADGNVLDNDTMDGAQYDGEVTAINGSAANVGNWIDGSNGGKIQINADGSYDFDADGDFESLNDGDTAQTTFSYQISSSGEVTAAQKQNIMFVIDVSGSTAPATFAGGSVGDLNGDGMSNTILDAQITSYMALSAELAAMNIDPNMVDIGLVAFNGSGVGTSGSITGDAQLLGTFKPGDNSLTNALQGLTDGGSTNFEAALYDTVDWFGDVNATTGDNNVVFFLSDGLNNTGNSFANEVSALENNYDASLIAVGVGNNADLGQLNQIDNTGGAEIVTTTDALTTSLIDGLTQVVDISDTATLTVTVLGENDFTIDAIDDAITVMEDETAGDNDGNALDNDLEDAGSYTGDVTEVAGDAANVGQWVAGSNGGLIKVNADGTFDFDANGEFDALDNGETAQTTFTYQIATGGGVTETETTVDFNAYGAGVVVTNQIAGVTVSSSDPNKPPMIFDTSNPTGGDTDLASTTAGNVLIISEDGDSSDPDDNAGVGSLYFDFDNPARLTSLTFLDTEESGYLRFYDDTGALIETLMIPTVADGGISTLDFDVAGVSRLEVNLCGSGAIDDLVFTTETTEPPIMDTATITVTVEGQTDYVAIADTMTVLASEAAGDQDLLDNGDDSVLDNDIEDGGAYAGNVLEVNSDANKVGQTVVGTKGGLLVINADGTMDFDANGEFDGLIDGASAQTQFTYTIEDGKTASVTVTILGETVRIAVDDVMTVMESESFGDADLLDSGEDSVLDNDTENGDAYTDVVGAVNGSLGNVNSYVTGSNGGLLKINADGTVDFDANGEFDGLADGATAQTTFTYELISGEEATVTVNVVGEANTVAVDDVITVMESETSGDLETLDSGASTVLANDTTDGAAYGGLVEAVNGTAGDVGTAVVGSNGGLATIYSDGTIDFDANDEFDFLDAGQTASTTFTYDIAGGEQATVTVNVEGEDNPTGGGQVINLALMLNSVATMFEDASTAIYGLPDYQDWDGNGVDNQVMDMAYLMLEDFMSDAFTVAANAGVTLNVSLISFGDTTGGEGSQFTSIYNAANFDAKLDAKIAADDSGDYGTGFDNANAWFDSVATAGDTNAVFFLGNGLYTDAWNAEFTAMVTDHNVAVDAYLPDAVFSGTALDDLGFIDKDGVAEAIYMDDVALAGTYGVTPGQDALSLDHLIL